MNRKAAPRGTQAVQRALKLLRSFSTPAEELSLGELAGRHDLARPTAHRILAALEVEGLIGRNPETATYRLTELSAALAIGRAAGGPPASDPGAVGWSRSARSERAESQLSLPRKTPFFERIVARHESYGWRDWSGYVLPTSYEPTFTREYYAIRNGVAMIDVTPLFKYEVSGPDALRLVQRTMTRDFSKCRVGQVMYTCWCDDDGQLVQDGNVIRLAKDRFRISAADPSLGWLQDCAVGMQVEVRDTTMDLGALSIQGPRSRQLLSQVLDDVDLDTLRYFRAAHGKLEGHRILVSRTGFTGDLGYELWIDREHATALWDRLIDVGAGYGLLPVGLVAMDAARIEAGLVLIEVDYVSALHAFLDGRKSSPYEAGLGWTVKLTPGNEFIGRAALEREQRQGSQWATVGIEISWTELERVHAQARLRPHSPGQPPCRDPAPLWTPDGGSAHRSRQVGQITSQTFSPLLKKQIGLASVEASFAGLGTELEVEIMVDRKRSRALGRVAALPFYDPPHKRSQGASARSAPAQSAHGQAPS